MGRDITGMQTRFDLPEEPVNNQGVKGQFPVGQLLDMLLDRFSACLITGGDDAHLRRNCPSIAYPSYACQ